MKHVYIFLSLLLISFLPGRSYAQTQSKGGSCADLAFIQGHWKANTPEGRAIEAVWLQPEGENILGFMRMMKGGKADLYEILAYEKSEQGLVSMVKHFKPGLLGVEEKDKQDRYNFMEASSGRAIFEKDGGGLRILYEKRSADQFAIARGNEQDGKWVFKDLFLFNRVK
jgi:hypothetical protein